MGAKPRWALLAGALPYYDERWLGGFARGLFALADRFDVALIGGDTTRGPRNLCLTIVGELPAGRRSCARCQARRRHLRVRNARRRRARIGGVAGPARLPKPTSRQRASASKRRSRAWRWASGCAASRPPPSTFPTGSPATCAISSTVRRWARRSTWRGSRARAASTRCWTAARATSARVRPGRRRRLRTVFHRGVRVPRRDRGHRARRGRSARRIGSITPVCGLFVRDERGVPLPALPRSFDHFAEAMADRPTSHSCSATRLISSRWAPAADWHRRHPAHSARWRPFRWRCSCAPILATPNSSRP